MTTFAQGKEFADKVFVTGAVALEDYPVDNLIKILKAADDLYTNEDESFLTDDQYDAVRRFAHHADPSNPYFVSVGSAVRGGKIKLPFQMGSLNQVYVGEWDQWVDANDLADELLVISDKEDGGSDMIRYDKAMLSIAYSRGDGEMGADITRHFKDIPSVPKKINLKESLTVRCEHIISRDNFKKLLALGARRRGGAPYKNPRNMVAGMMNASDTNPEYLKYVDVIAYEVVGSKLPKVKQLELLASLGFKVVPYTTFTGATLTEKLLTAHLEKRRNESSYEIDGVVAEVNSASKRSKMDSGELNPGYAVKFKVADSSNFAIATVKHVEYNVSKDGYYKPRVHIQPVDLVGVTIQHLTGFNAKFILESKIGPGAKIRITRSGDVIPFIMGVETPAVKAQMPDDTAAVWNATGVDLMVADVNSNETVKFERLNDFFSSIDVPHLGEGNLKELFDLGFDTPESIIQLSLEDLCSAIGSKANGKKIFEGMRKKFTNIPMYELMGSHSSFGRGVGVRKMKKLYEAFSGKMDRCQSVSQIIAVEGFDVKTATKIATGYDEFIAFLDAIDGFVTIKPFEAKKQGKLTGMTFVFTGFRNSDLEKQIVEQGGSMGTAVSSKTTYLVTAEANSTSGKAKAARDKGVAVIGLDELKKML